MGVDGPHKTAEYLQNTLKARLPLVVAGSQSALYVPSKGRPDMSILMPGIYPKPRPVAQTHGKVGKGAECPRGGAVLGKQPGS